MRKRKQKIFYVKQTNIKSNMLTISEYVCLCVRFGSPIFEFGRKEYQKRSKSSIYNREWRCERGERQTAAAAEAFCLVFDSTLDHHIRLRVDAFNIGLRLLFDSNRSDAIGTLYIQWVSSNGFGKMNASVVSCRRHHRLRFLCRFYCCHVLCVDLSMDCVCIRFF